MAGLNTMTFPGKPGRAVSRGNSDRGDLPAVGEVATCAGIAGPFSVAFLNRKGGGKTSCCHHLAGCFARSGRRWKPRLTLDVYHLFSNERPVDYDQFHYYNQDADGNQIDPNPAYGEPIRYYPPTTVRLGLGLSF